MMTGTRRSPTSQRQPAALSMVLLLAGLTLSAAAQEDELAKELPRIKPLSPAAALESFRIHDGFHLEAVAVEPMVADPVSVCYDAHGRLYVVEMRGYPYPEKTPSGQVTHWKTATETAASRRELSFWRAFPGRPESFRTTTVCL